MLPDPSPVTQVQAVLRREKPARFVYAPNYWQWFTHHQNHGLLPPEMADCATQLDMLRHLGVDVFSRNLYCDPTRFWFGGMSDEVCEGVEVEERRFKEGPDTVTEVTYRTSKGVLTERLRFVFAHSTLVQEKYLLNDYPSQIDAFGELVRCRRWRFNTNLYQQWQSQVCDMGVVNVGELLSPLETERLTSHDAVRRYVEGLFRRMEQYRHRFIFSSSCNTSINAPWQTLVWFRDAWREFGP